jgi:tetratricopeptide (TPR) repeat protein
MEENTPRFNWPDLIQKIPGWIMGLIAFVSAVVGFIKLWQGDTGLMTAVLLVVGVGGGLLGCAYLVLKRTPPQVEGGKGTWKYHRWRPLALAGLIVIPLLTAAVLGRWWYAETHRPDQVVVLVANFYQEGTEEDPYGLTGILLGRLQGDLAEERIASVTAIQQPITAQQGSDRAHQIGRQHLYMLTLGDRAIGQKRQTAIVIWGWYAVTEEKAWVDAHFEVVRPPGGLPEIHLDRQVATLAELEHFDFQVSLSRDMACLTTFTVGLVHFEGEAYEAAIATFSKAIELRPDLAEPYNNRGAAYSHRGKYDQAIDDYDRAIKLDPNYTGAYNNRGWTYYKQGDYEQAIADYHKAIELDPNYVRTYNNRGVAYADLGDYEQAIADYNEAIELNHDPLSWPYNNRGVAYADLGDYEQAIADYHKAIELDPNYAGAYNNRGVAYADLGDYEQAIADYNKAIELRPDLAEAYYNRGVAHKTKGEKEEAIRDFERFLELSEDEYRRECAEKQLKELRGQ